MLADLHDEELRWCQAVINKFWGRTNCINRISITPPPSSDPPFSCPCPRCARQSYNNTLRMRTNVPKLAAGAGAGAGAGVMPV